MIFSLNLFAQVEYTGTPYEETLTQNPTYLNIARPENILVVFKRDDNNSEGVKDYYVSNRNLPSYNIIRGTDNEPGLLLPDFIITGQDTVILDNEGEVIKQLGDCTRLWGQL